MPNIRWLLATITAVHRFLYQKSGGRIGARAPGGKCFLLLDTVGRRTGRRRVLPLLYATDGERFAVAASNAGDRRPPAWCLNLRASPAARVQVGTRRFDVRAHLAHGAERDLWWPRLDAAYPNFAAYRQRAGREIPVVVLEPAGAAEIADSAG